MIKWPVEETGMNSVSPSTIPRMTAMAQFPTVLPGALRPLHFFHREFDDRRQQRNENHDGDDHVDALADIGKCLAEEVAAERRGEDPKDAAPDVVRDEAPVVHAGHAGDHRSESADDRNEACDDDRETAVLLIELLRGKQMLAAEDERVLALENFGPGAPSDRVADRVAGDTVGYAIGRRTGPKIFKREDSLIFRRKHLLAAQEFYEKHGGFTIVVARFIPIIRTFAPVVAGVAGMHYRRFIAYNVWGGIFWVLATTLGGYFLGKTFPNIGESIHMVIAVVIFVSLLPAIIKFAMEKMKRAQRAR